MSDKEKPSYVVLDDYFVDWSADIPIIQFPYHVQQLLYELTINYLIHRPADSLSYILDFFKQLKASRRIEVVYDVEPRKKASVVAGQRRHSVFAKVFDPSEEAIFQNVVYPKTKEDRERLKVALKDLFFFKHLDELDFSKVLDAMFLKKVRKGEIVIQQGDDGDFFYVIRSGNFNAIKTKDGHVRDLHHYANSGYFGELALLYNQPRAATVVAVTDGELWALDRDTFQKIVLSSSFQRSRRYESMIERVPILSHLDPAERVKLADALIPRDFAHGEEIVRQGDPANGMYFVESGNVVVFRRSRNQQNVFIKRLQEGEYFGELALLTSKPRAATVVAEGKVKTAFLEVAAFERLLGPCVNIMKRNISLYEEQLREVLGSDHNVSDLRPS